MPFLLIPSLGWIKEPLLLPRDGQAEAEEAQWLAIEARGLDFDGRDCGVKCNAKPHPKSYRPDIPLGNPWRKAHSGKIPKGLLTLQREEVAVLAGREIVYGPGR